MKLNRCVQGRCGLVLIAAGLLAGCQSYTPRPLELDGYASRLEARLDDTQRIAEFARSLFENDEAGEFDLSDGLSCAEAEVLALFYNPELRVVRAEAGIAEADARHAGLWEDPEFGFDAAQVLSPGSQFDFGATLGLTLPISGRLGIERDRADAAHEAALLRIADAEWNLRIGVRKAWADWVLAEGRYTQYVLFAEQSEQLLETIDRLVEVGELGRIEGRLVWVERAVHAADTVGAEFAAAEARGKLLAMIGLPADSKIEFENLLPSDEQVEMDFSAERLIAANTALAVLVKEYEVAEHALRYEVRKQFPDISLGGGFGSEDDDERLLFGVTLPIPVLNANRAGIARAHAERDAARVRAEIKLDEVQRGLLMAAAQSEAVRQQREMYIEGIAPMLETQTQEIRELADLGEIRTLVLLETLARHMQTKKRVLELSAEQAKSNAEVARFRGPTTDRQGPILVRDEMQTEGGAK